MKKVFLLTLGLVLGFGAFAQKANVSNEAKSFTLTVQKPSAERISDGSAMEGVTFNMPQSVMMASTRDSEEQFEEFPVMMTNYDLQTNSALGNRIAVWPDGAASFTATWDASGNTSYPDRGTGYNFFDGSYVGDFPEARQEPIKTGWPSITACGNGEILISHGGTPTSTHIYKRATRGEGEWTEVGVLTGVQWPRIVVSGDNDQYVHIFGANQENIGTSSDPYYINHLYYVRSTDGGETWPAPEELSAEIIDNSETGMYKNQISADDYIMASNGNNVAILFGGYTYEVFYIISHDNGETWEKQIVAPWCEPDSHAHNYDDFPEGTPYKMISEDNSHSIAIDDNGVVHVVFAMFRWYQTDVDHYTYYPMYNYGIVYWNSEYENEQGGHEIPLLGNWSGDSMFEEEYGDTISYSLDIERVDTLCRIDGGEHLWYFGYPIEIDEFGDTAYYQSAHCLNRPYHYRSLGMSTQPGISVDNNGDVAVIYNQMSKVRVESVTDMYYKNAWVSFKKDGVWYDDAIYLSAEFEHEYDEVYSTTASARAYDGEFWMLYSADEKPGLFLDKNDTYPQSNGGALTENNLFAIRLTPQPEGVVENSINPMTTVRAYPNPASDMMTIEINASMASEMTINIFNITGQNVMNKNVNVNAGINNTQINVSELGSGVYFCSVNANGFNKTVKVIVK